MKRVLSLFLTWLLMAAALAGCRSGTAAPQPILSRVPAVTRTPPPVQTSWPQPTATVATITDTLTLTWWTPEFLSPRAPAPAGPLLAAQVADFESARGGNVRLNPILKARYGKGGLLDFLRTAQPVAPSVLPDLVTLDVAELEQANSLGLLQPLDGLLPPEVIAGLYPFARQVGQLDGRTLAIPWVADLDHVIYDQGQITQPPSTWVGVITQGLLYVFPAGPLPSPSAAGLTEDVQPTFIAQYLSAGGSLDPKTRRLTLQEQPLVRVLSFYRDANEAHLLPKNILNIVNTDDAWNAFGHEGAALATVSGRRYLAQRNALPNVGFAPAPGWANPVTPVARGWALLITTADPARQRAAADFIAWLIAPERSGALAQAVGWLPTSAAALATWGNAPYFGFLDGQLASAVGPPGGPDYPPVSARLQKAVTAVLKGAMSPTEAAQAAMSGK